MERPRSYAGRLVTDRNGEMRLFIPFYFGRSDDRERTEAANGGDPRRGAAAGSESNGGPDDARVVLVNPLYRSSIVLERVSDFVALFGDLFQGKPGQPPASKASIAAMPEVEIVGDEQDLECSICLEGMKMAKEMPCKHRFHSGCVEKWLRVHGSCPVCRYQMPRGDEDGDEGEIVRRIFRRAIWIPFAVENSNHSPNQGTEQRQTEDHQNSD